MTRDEANVKLIELLSEYLVDFPDCRFGQALLNLNIIKTPKYNYSDIIDTIYFEESKETLERAINAG